MRLSKFLIPYSFSILSFFISVTVLDLYDRMGKTNEMTSPTILGKVIQSTAQMGVLTLYFGVPIILGGCLLGELLFRGIILQFKLSYIISLLLYLLLAFSIVFVTVGIPTTYEDSNTFFMGITMICAVTFFVGRNIGEKKQINNGVTK
jgi:membrane protease YdiL (CAAX protease family)